MDANPPLCRVCSIEMAAGVVLDRGEDRVVGSSWHEGTPPPRTFFGFAIKGTYNPEADKVHAIVGYRCPECGLLELYAR
jgi:hypothetical protein